MTRVFVALCALALLGCWDFRGARTACEQNGGCVTTDAGTMPVEEVDAGPMPPFTVVAPTFSPDAAVFTSTGFRWEYPYPAGTELHQLAVVSDQELWASGNDDLVLHLKHGEEPHYEVLPAGEGGMRSPDGARLVALHDGGLLAGGEGSLQSRRDGTWFRHENWSFSPAVGVRGDDGTPWFGGSATSLPCGVGVGVIREGAPPSVERCAMNSTGAIVGIDPTGWAVDTGATLHRRTGDTWVVMRSFGGTIERDHASLLAMPGGSFFVTGSPSGKLSTVDSMGVASPQDVLLGDEENGQIYRSLARTGDGGVLLVGTAGAFRHEANGTWTRESSTIAGELQAVGAGPRSEYAVGTAGQVLRRESGMWRTLVPGAVGMITDVFLDVNGVLWAAWSSDQEGGVLKRENGRWVSHATGIPGAQEFLETADGQFWLVSATALHRLDTAQGLWTPQYLFDANGMKQSWPADLKLFGGAGGPSGNAWLFGNGAIYGYDGTRWKLHSLPPDAVYGVFVTDGGTAWASTNAGSVLSFDGTSWSKVAALDAGVCRGGTWSPQPDFTYVGCTGGVARVGVDGGVQLSVDAGTVTFLTGKVLSDGRHLLIGGFESRLWRSFDGPDQQQDTPVGIGLNLARARAFGTKLYVGGDRPRDTTITPLTGAILSLDLQE
jgi:hypothetical protein